MIEDKMNVDDFTWEVIPRSEVTLPASGANPNSIVARVLDYLDDHPGSARSLILNHIGTVYNERHDSISSAIAYLVLRGLVIESVSFRTYEGMVTEGPVRCWKVV
jgi:hypothetical protein